MAHSRVLAELLDPARHAGAEMILRSLLHEVSGLLDRDDGDASREIARALEQIAEGPFGRVAVHRESMLIDVVVELSGPAGEAVVGIENKIDAGEQPE